MTTSKMICALFLGWAIAAASALAVTLDATAPTGTVPNASEPESDAQESVSPAKAAALLAEHAYENSVFEALSTSPVPRDWALAALMPGSNWYSADRAQQSQRNALLRRASKAAPDDALVQWIASMSPDEAGRALALEQLQSIEPQNAAAWLQSLAHRSLQKEGSQTDITLMQMASSTRFDEHHADLLAAVIDVFTRYPAPEEMQSLNRAAFGSENPALFSKELAPHAMAIAISFAVASPYQVLVSACRINPATGSNALRSANCAAIGRLMAEHGTIFSSNRIGFALLRVSRSFNSEDIEHARSLDWLYQGYTSSVGDLSNPHLDTEVITHDNDWIAAGSEAEAARRALVRAGLPLTPPDDWIDKQSPFSEERLAQDDASLQTRSATQ